MGLKNKHQLTSVADRCLKGTEHPSYKDTYLCLAFEKKFLFLQMCITEGGSTTSTHCMFEVDIHCYIQKALSNA